MPAATTPSLRAFLEQPARPAGTLTYDELQGFLFAVVSAPEPIQPSEWLPIIFNEQDAGYATLEEAQLILGHIKIVAQAPRRVTRVGRNNPCPCGSGKKFKKCCDATSY